jgi:sec-independent protein translocase protein TatB
VFDVGFWELMMVGLVALLVFGPERLPTLARTAGMWLGRARRFLGTVKADIEQELKAEELKRILGEQQLKNPLHEFIEDTRGALADVRTQAERALQAPDPAASAQAEDAASVTPAPVTPASATGQQPGVTPPGGARPDA